MKRTGQGVALAAACLSLILGGFLSITGGAEAQGQLKSIEGVKFDVSVSLKDNFKSFSGKDVSVTLRSGKTYQGLVKAVGDNLIHLEKIAGKDFYDVLIRLEDISAMEVKFRDLK